MDTQDEKQALTLAKAVVYRLFKFRPRSEREIITKLKEKNFESGIIEQVISFFKNCEMIDDTVFAKSWIASRLNKPMGLRRIRQELKEKGISDEIISAGLANIKVDYDENEAVTQVAQKRLRIYKGLDKNTIKRRLEGYLLRRGFSTEAIYKVMKRPGGPEAGPLPTATE